MKKIAGWILIAFMLTLIVLCSGCDSIPGKTEDYNDVVIEYNHTQYKVKQIQLGKATYDYIYVMYPINDTTKSLPSVISYGTPAGKSISNQAVVILK